MSSLTARIAALEAAIGKPDDFLDDASLTAEQKYFRLIHSPRRMRRKVTEQNSNLTPEEAYEKLILAPRRAFY